MAARPAPTQPGPERVVLIGCAGSGKTTLARALAVRLGARHIERDALGDDEGPGFASQVAAAVDAASSRWVFDGAPYNAEMVVYPHADTVVALDYPRWVVQRRVLTRSVRLWLTRRADGAHTSSEPPWRWSTAAHPVAGPRGPTPPGTPRSPSCSHTRSWPTLVGCGSPRPARPPPGWSACAAEGLTGDPGLQRRRLPSDGAADV
jgi:hypothetical protein